MGKIFSIMKRISDYVEKDVKNVPGYLNEKNNTEPEIRPDVLIKTNIYIPEHLNRINKVVSIVSFVLSSKEIYFDGNKKLGSVNYGVLVRYLDDYLSEQTYFNSFKSYVGKEPEQKFKIGTVNAVKNFTVVTGRYIKANVILQLE